jgi:hypothetical protein
MSQPIVKAVAGVAALAAIAFGASAIAGASGSRSNNTAFPGPGPPQGMNGGPPPGAPGGGTPVTGATAAKVKAAALARYPGTVERVVATPNGGYIAHVFTSSGGEVHVLVNKQFQVTGIATRPPGAPGGPPQGQGSSS